MKANTVKKLLAVAMAAAGLMAFAKPSVEITKVSLADTYDGTYNYSYTVDGDFEGKEYDLLIKVSVANGTKSTVLTNESIAAGTVNTNVNVKTLFGKAYPNVTFFAELKGLDGVRLWKGGPIWAGCNVGATKPEETGYHFWWGDTVGYKRNGSRWDAVDGSKTGFSFSSGNCPTYNKTVAQLYSGGYIDANSADGKLKPEYDAARAHLKGDWRMPTDAEFQALIDNCNRKWTTLNGVKGYAVTGKGDYASKGIFLPATGNADLSYLDSNSHGYRSSAPYSDSNKAVSLVFSLSDFSWGYALRYYGHTVRPVR